MPSHRTGRTTGGLPTPWVSNSSLPQLSSCPEGQADIVNSPVAIPTMVPISTGHVRGHTTNLYSFTLDRSFRCHRMPKPGCMAYLRESFLSRRVSPEASKLLLSSWRPKTQSSYNSALASWCEQRNRDPTSGPIEDIVNFRIIWQGFPASLSQFLSISNLCGT